MVQGLWQARPEVPLNVVFDCVLTGLGDGGGQGHWRVTMRGFVLAVKVSSCDLVGWVGRGLVSMR